MEMPRTVSNLLVAGEVRIFNFMESMNLLNVRKEMENWQKYDQCGENSACYYIHGLAELI